MALDQVLTEVRQDGDRRAKAILDKARAEASAILAEAKSKAHALEQARLADAARDGSQALSQAQSRAESEGRKVVLAAEAGLRTDLRRRMLTALADLPAKTREKHVKALLERAAEVIPSGKVWGSEKDAAVLAKAKTYTHAGSLPIAGGLIVESDDGLVRLDLSYETLLDGEWRNILKAESGLFA